MLRRRLAGALAGACVFAAAAGCADVRVEVSPAADLARPVRVGVLNFDCAADVDDMASVGGEFCPPDGVGATVADAMAAALVSVPRLRVVERTRMVQLLGELELTRDRALTPSGLRRLGEAAGVDAVLLGHVSEYHEWQVGWSRGSRVAFTVRMVDASTGEVTWSASCSRRASVGPGALLHGLCADVASRLRGSLGG